MLLTVKIRFTSVSIFCYCSNRCGDEPVIHVQLVQGHLNLTLRS